jgi:hypothetical protein
MNEPGIRTPDDEATPLFALLLRAYAGAEAVEEYGGTRGAIEAFIAAHPGERAATAAEAARLLAADDASLSRALRELGLAFVPSRDGFGSERGFVAAVRSAALRAPSEPGTA